MKNRILILVVSVLVIVQPCFSGEDVREVVRYLERRDLEHLVLGEVREDVLEVQSGHSSLLRATIEHLWRIWASKLEELLTGGSK